MPIHPHRPSKPTKRDRTRPVIVLCVLGACLTLAACGGSSSSATSSASSKSATSASKGAGSARSTALRECLVKEGITLPSAPGGGNPPSSGSAPPTGSGGQRPGGGFTPPKGESTAQLQAALKKCGGGNFPAGGSRFNGANSGKALAKFSACMRENGVNLPTPNSSGKGPVFNTKGINTSGAAFKNAESKCRSDLGAAAGSGGPPNGGAPPSGGEAPSGGSAPAGKEGPTGEEEAQP